MPAGQKRTRIKRSVKLQATISAVVLLILALGFNALLSLNSLEKLYVESIASQYSAIGKDLQRNLEQSLRFGKSLKKFIGIDKMLEETKNNLIREYFEDSTAAIAMKPISAVDISVSVVLPDGAILYSTDEKLVDTTLPKHVRIDYETPEDEGHPSHDFSYVKYANMYYTSLPVHDMKKQWVATAIIAFDEKQVRELLDTVRNTSIKMSLIILVGSIILLILLLNLVTLGETRPYKSLRFRISLVMLLVIGLAQIVFSGWNTDAFRRYYLQINKQKARTLTTLLKEDIEFLFSKGIRINKLVKMDFVMGEIIAASPELNDITILDKHDIPLYMATKQGVIDFQNATNEQLRQAYSLMSAANPDYNVRLNLLKDQKVEGTVSVNMSKEGFLSTNLSKDVILAKLFEIALDSGTILIISILFFVELFILLFQFMEQQITGVKRQKSVHYGAIRPAAFLLYFGLNVSVSFLPLYMETLYEPILGFSKDIVMGLPLSVTMLFAGIGIFIAGTWIDRRGWHEAFFNGLLLTSCGLLYSWLAPDALHFILARGLVGLGYGFAMMAAQGFVISHTDEGTKAQGLTRLEAGSYAGYICGSATGAMLAQRIGYNPVFLVGALILLSSIVYALFFMRHAIRKPVHQSVKHPAQSVGVGQYVRFLFNKNIFSLSLFVILPTALLSVGFLYYLIPVYLNRIGTSQSNIGRLLMLYGLFFIYVAPFISKYIDRSENKKMYIVTSGILGSLAFGVFYILGGFAASLAAVLLLGLAGSVNASNAYVLRLKITQKLGGGKAMSLLSTVDRIGQVLGPMVFGWLLITVQINKGITYLGLAYFFVILLFFLSARGLRREPIPDTPTTS